MTKLESSIISTALNKMRNDGWFSICTIDNILQITKGIPDKKSHDLLRAIHCVKFVDMPQDVRDALPELIIKCIGNPPYDLTLDIAPYLNSLKRITA
jgi:hypothetical protein